MSATLVTPTRSLDAKTAASLPASESVRHHFTVDVEEYFQVSAMEPHVPRSRWPEMESRVEASMERLLGLLAHHRAPATCFVLGCVAERHPQLVRDIAQAGHEVASHGYDHKKVTEVGPEEFRLSIRRTKTLLEDLTGQPVVGYRAPSFSIVPGREWALDVLVEEGYRYDSSLFPIRRPGYGYATGGRDVHWLDRPSGRLAEVPPATLRFGGLNVPAAGGAYFRLFPYALVQTALRDAACRGQAGTFYIHPWEWDPEQPRLEVSALTRVRHYGGIGRTWSRLERLLSEFRFTTVADTVRAL